MTGNTPDRPLRAAISITRRDLLAGAGAILGGLAIDAGEIARHDIEVVHRPISITRLPEAFRGFRIVQISDIHLEEFTEASFLKLVVHRVNHLAPDLVVLTGDFASSGPLPHSVGVHGAQHCAEVLKSLACPQRYAILGNHDTNIGTDIVVDALKASNIPVLINQHVPIERDGQRFWLCGLDDAGTANPILDLAVPRYPDAPVILMCHEPDFADSVIRHPRGPLVDLMLSGHTHGGQIRLPFLGALVLPPMGRRYIEGLFHLNRMQLYVNRGIGTVGLPLRFNCPPEITVITLQPA